jgi:hypothetical protein
MSDRPTPHEFLFGRGLTLQHYFIERTPVSEVIGFTDDNGRAFDLHISDDELALSAKSLLLELGVRVIDRK